MHCRGQMRQIEQSVASRLRAGPGGIGERSVLGQIRHRRVLARKRSAARKKSVRFGRDVSLALNSLKSHGKRTVNDV